MPFLFVMALVVPLVYSNATIDPVEPPRFLMVACLAVVVVSAFGLAVLRSKAALAVTKAEAIVVGCLVAYVLVGAISLGIAGITPDGIFALLKLATFACLLLAASRAIDPSPPTMALLAKLVVASCFLVGGFAILQYYQIAIFEWMKTDTTVDSTMGHRNLLASFLVLGFPFVVYAFLELDGFWRGASAVTLSIAVFLLVALQSRATWVAFPTGLACSLLVLGVAMRRAPTPGSVRPYRRRSFQGAVLVAVGLGLALLLYSPASRAPMREHVGSMVQLGQASIHERLQLWSRTLRMIRDHPLTGVGPGNWRIILPTYGLEGTRADTGTLHFQRPHNDFLWAASEAGLVGGLLYAALFASALGLGVMVICRGRSTHDRLVGTLMLWGVACDALDSLFSFPMERTSHWAYLTLLIGTLLSLHRHNDEKLDAWSPPRPWATAVVALAWVTMLFAAGFAWSRDRAEIHLRRALEARAARDWSRMVAELERIDPRSYDLDPSSAPVAWYRGVARFEMQDLAGAEGDFRTALTVHPNHVHVLNNLATCQTLRGDTQGAIRTYERAIEIAPRFEDARTNLASLLHDLHRDQEAYEVLAPNADTAVSPRFKACFQLVKSALGLRY